MQLFFSLDCRIVRHAGSFTFDWLQRTEVQDSVNFVLFFFLLSRPNTKMVKSIMLGPTNELRGIYEAFLCKSRKS